MHKEYSYVGPKDLLSLINKGHQGEEIHEMNDLHKWLKRHKEMVSYEHLTATFIISKRYELLLNDRHSEHVVCANGENVLAAGEITFCLEEKIPYVSEISNQSTGYCPEIQSWNVVSEVLNKIGIKHPRHYTSAFEFRYCQECKSTNIIKDNNYCCAICGGELDTNWNYEAKGN